MKVSVPDLRPTPAFPRRTPSRVLLSGVVAGGLALTVFATFQTERAEQTQVANSFRKLADYQMAANHERLRLIEELIAGLRRTIMFQGKLTREEFDGICADISSAHQGFISLQWVEEVAGPDREDVERMLGADYGYPIPFKARTSANTFEPAPRADSYRIIRHAYPFEPNASVLGYNLHTGPNARDLDRAAREGALAVSAPFRLAQSHDDEAELGIIFIVPVTTQRPQGAALKGFVQCVFPTSGVFGPALLPEFKRNAHYRYLDQTDPKQPPVLIFPETPPDRAVGTTSLLLDQTLQVGGREWHFTAEPKPEWLRHQHNFQSKLILGGGLVITALLFLLIRGFVRRAQWVETLVEERTQELLSRQSELKAIIDNSPNAIWIKDLEGRYLVANKEMGEIFNRDPDEAIGQTDSLFFPPERCEELREADRRALESESHILTEGEFNILGEQRHFYTVKFPVRKPDGTPFGVGGIATDVTQFKRVETQLAETQKLESLGVLAGGIAHDFNNLLTGILGNASLIAHDLPPATETGKCVQEIENAAIRAAELCRQMLAYSGRGSFVTEQINLSKAVAAIVPLLRSAIGSRLDLRLDLAENVPLVEGDPSQMQQIIMNLVINASEALVDGNGRVVVTTSGRELTRAELQRGVGHPDLPAGLYTSFKVQDNGVGIEPAKLKRIFEPFFTTKFTGRGLGLSAVLGIVRSHKGALLVESQVGQGTTFELLLPATRKADGPTSAEPVAPAATGALEGKRVFLVDDEKTVCDLICRIVTTAGAHCDSFTNGADAVAAFRAGRYDLAILDLTLPGMSGREIFEHIRARDPVLRTLIISGYSANDTVANWGEATPHGFLQKPFSATVLRRTIDAAILRELA